MSGNIETLTEDNADEKLDEILDDRETDHRGDLVETEPATPAEPSDDYGETHDLDEAPGGPNRPGRVVADTDRVRLDDGRAITVAELKAGNLRQADYTRKTQDLAAQRKSLEERNARYQQLEANLAHERAYVFGVLHSITPQAPDRSLLQENPVAYMDAKHVHDQGREHLLALKQQYVQAWQRAQEEHVAQLDGAIREGKETFFELRPDIQRRFEAWRDDVWQFAPEAYGFTSQELWQVGDHRWLMALTDAVQWRKLQTNKSKSLAKADGKPPVRPGRRQDPKASSARVRKSDLQQLQATGGRDEKSLDRLLDNFI